MRLEIPRDDPMIHSAPAGVKAVVRTQHDPPRQISFAFRADPTALDDMKLPRTARDAFGLVLDNARLRGGRCRLSNGTMARVLGCSAPTVKRALAALEAAGLIRRETIAGGRVRLCIHVTWEGVDQPRATGQTTVDHPRPRGGSSAIQGVDHLRSTNQSPIQRGDQTGPILPIEGEDAEEAALYAALGPARYLRAMIAKGKVEAAARSAVKSPPSPPASAAPTPEAVVPPDRPAEASRAPRDEPAASPAPIPAPVADRPAAATPAAFPTSPRCVEPRPTPRTAVPSPSTSAPRPSTAPVASPTYSPAPTVPASDVMAMVRRMVGGVAKGLKAEDVGRRRVGPKRLAAQLAEVRRRHGRPGGMEI